MNILLSRFKYKFRSPVIFSLVLVIALGLLPQRSYAESSDPWLFLNEQVFRFNDYFDQLLVKPASASYVMLTPRRIRKGISNFFNNIQDINIAVNNFLQLKIDAGASDSARVFINSTVGVAGLLDVASALGLERHEEDFGQTLGRWGVGSGPYVFLPVFGASSLRDSVGLIFDTAFNPLNYYDEIVLRLALYLVDEIDFRSSLLGYDELISGDRYLFVREAYIQNRNYLISDGIGFDEFREF
jgi:phospholipid-binding lipoprotein MlaA